MTRLRAHVLRREQRLAAPVSEVFPFFADARNLEAITPPLLGFSVVQAPAVMRAGALIEYRLRLHGVRVGWLTVIAEWEPGVRFVDVQLQGPYALWHHTHEFLDDGGGGTVMRDTVRYQLPLGVLGAVGLPLVRRDLSRIFDFRAREVAARFSSSSA